MQIIVLIRPTKIFLEEHKTIEDVAEVKVTIKRKEEEKEKAEAPETILAH